MNVDLHGKRAVVTGGTRGIGRAIVETLANAGADVLLCGRSQKDVEETARAVGAKAGCKVVGVRADVRSGAEVSHLFIEADRMLGGVDILVNNAGIGIFRSVAELTEDEWKQTLDTNLTAVFYCCHQALVRMRQKGGGAIINISSLAGKNAFPGGAAYNASKFGLNGFTEALMLDHRNDNIRVTCIMPGSVDTDFSPGSGRAGWKIAPEDVAQVVMAILSMPDRTLVSRVEMRPSKPPK